MNIIYRKKSKKRFITKWLEYIKENFASYNYLLNWLEYQRCYIKNLYSDESFVILLDSKPIAICFLPIEIINGIKSISIGKGYVPSPLALNYKIEKQVFKIIDKIAIKEKVKQIKFFLDPLILEYQGKCNILMKHGFIDSSSVSGILDLKKSQKDLRLNLRRGTRCSIKQMEINKEIRVLNFDCLNIKPNVHELYRKLHFKCAGRRTRSKKTFDQQRQMLKKDKAAMFGLRYKKKFIGFAYFLHFKKTTIYASAADEPKYNKLPISHILIWTAILYYQKRGFDFMNFPQPYGYSRVGGFDDYQDQKQINIAFFKRGFGTRMVPLFRGIKYFDKNLFLKDLKVFKNKVLKII